MTYVHQFSLEPSFCFPEFIQWSASNYSKSERVVINSTWSRVLFRIDVKTVKHVVNVLETMEFEQLNEEECSRIYKETNVEKKVQLLSKNLKP